LEDLLPVFCWQAMAKHSTKAAIAAVLIFISINFVCLKNEMQDIGICIKNNPVSLETGLLTTSVW
jgi:hypothetical protein